jgi:HD-like signal output (HDOD) protein/ActR/RegA family two-component response regulator
MTDPQPLKRILFVDDEPKILEGLQRMLRPMRESWEMNFANNGEAALTQLREGKFDVVVTDMRMPGMDGAALLSEVRLEYPHMVRIVLSGHSDEQLILSSVGQAHQYLSKPCEADLLKDTIGRACALRDLLSDTSLTLLISKMQSLPSLPSLYRELMQELEAEDPSTKRIAAIIGKDPGMTAKILQMVNSAFFGLRRQISCPADAVSLLGIDIVKSLALSIQIFSQFKSIRIPGLSLEDLWEHNLQVATLAKQIAKAEKQKSEVVEQSFTAGLLHECGKLVLASCLPDEYGRMLETMKAEGLKLIEAEHRELGASHPEVGAYLLGLWGLPDSIVEAVAFHQNPNTCPGEVFSPLTAVCVADYLLDEADSSEVDKSVSGDEVSIYLERLKLEERLAVWKDLRSDNND